MKKLLLIKTTAACILLILVIAIGAHAQEKITLQKAVDLTLQNNLTIKQAQFSEAIDYETLQQSKYNMLPNLSGNLQPTVNFGRSIDPSTNQFINQRIFGLNGTLSTQIVLFQGQQLHNQIIQNKILLDADKSYTAKVKNDLVLNVVTTYLQVLSNQDLVSAAKQQIDIANQTLDKTQKSFKVGNLTLADLSQAKAQVSTAEYNLVNTENQLESSTLALKQYMEMSPATAITIERPDISKIADTNPLRDPEAILNAALKVNPDVSLAVIRRDAANQGVKIAKGAYYPTLALFGQLGSNYSDARTQSTYMPGVLDSIGYVKGTNAPVLVRGSSVVSNKYPFLKQFSDNFNQAVGVTLQIPVFTRFNTRTNVRKAKINFENAEVAAQLAKNNLSKIIYQAIWDLQASEKQYASAQQTYQANKDALNVTQQRYNVGLVNSLDYNTSVTNLNKSEFDMIQAKYMVVFRKKVIDYYLGNPIVL